MARKRTETVTCDRCTRHISTRAVDPDGKAPEKPASTPTVGIRVTRLMPQALGVVSEETAVEFRDLCETCEPAVANILKRLLLEEPEETGKRKKGKDVEKPAEKSGPADPPSDPPRVEAQPPLDAPAESSVVEPEPPALPVGPAAPQPGVTNPYSPF